MKKAVIQTGSKQYVVTEGSTIEIELLGTNSKKTIEFEPLLVIDGDKTTVGAPFVADSKVTGTIVEENVQGDKVTAIRYKSKKRVHKVRGHRQRHAVVSISKIV